MAYRRPCVTKVEGLFLFLSVYTEDRQFFYFTFLPELCSNALKQVFFLLDSCITVTMPFIVCKSP